LLSDNIPDEFVDVLNQYETILNERQSKNSQTDVDIEESAVPYHSQRLINPELYKPLSFDEITKGFFEKEQKTVSRIPFEQETTEIPLSSFQKKNGYIDQTTSAPEHKTTGSEPIITEKQLRALSRKHLLMMIFDIQEELIRTKEENEKMLTAYKAGIAQMQKMG